MAALSGSICVGRGGEDYGDVDDVAVVLEVLRQLGDLRRERVENLRQGPPRECWSP